MSITSSLNSALSGMSAASRAAETVSNNVANAMTEGYGKREVTLAARANGGSGRGVQVLGELRLVDEALITDRRFAGADQAQTETQAEFLRRIENLVGTPEVAGSLSDRLARFESSLIEASSRPDSEVRLSAVVTAAKELTTKFDNISDGLQSIRMEADRAIASEVETLNQTLQDIETLNANISYSFGRGQDASALFDQRQVLVDKVSEIIPVHQVPRERGKIALFTPGGAILTDGKAAELSFQAVGVITPHLTLQATFLSGLSINGVAVSTASDKGPIAGGRLAALFATRDEVTVNAQAQLDAVARDLVERFQDPNVDPTLGPTDAGLFTDGGIAFTSTNEVGLSQRLSINALADPAQTGGAVWRIRDGLGATAPGNPGNTTQIRSLLSTLETERSPASGNFLAATRTAASLSSDFLSLLSTERQAAETKASFADAQFQTLKGRELSMGVDTDEEMQKLLMIEAAYSANAKVIQTVDDMIETLLGL